MGIKDKLRNSLQGPITVMQPSYQDQTGADANYFVQLDSKYDFGMPDSSTKTDRLDFSAYPSEYQAEYHISEQQQQHGEEMQFGTPDGPRVPRLEEENDEFSEYLNLMVHFRERDFSKTLRKIDVSFFTNNRCNTNIRPDTLCRDQYRLLPPYLFAYLLCFMDRTNVGNAKVAGLLDSITMTGHEYNAGVVSWQRFILMAQITDVGLVFFVQACFFIFYIILEIPSQFVLKKIGPRRYLSLLVILCGIGQYTYPPPPLPPCQHVLTCDRWAHSHG